MSVDYGSVAAAVSPVLIILYLAVVVFYVACQWILVAKAGEPGWSVIIPIYNIYIMLKIGGKPGIWILLMMIPFVNIVIGILTMAAFLRAYGRDGAGPVLLMLFFPYIYLPYLALSKNVQFVGSPS